MRTGIGEYEDARALALDFYKDLTGEKKFPQGRGLDSPDGKFRIRVRRRQRNEKDSFDVIGYKRIQRKKDEKGTKKKRG